MSINEQQSAFVDPTAVSIGLSQIFSVTATSPNPAYLVLTALDRAEYTAGEAGATGNFFGNGHTLNLSASAAMGAGPESCSPCSRTVVITTVHMATSIS